MTAEEYGLTRRMWHQLEPVHAVFWYAPQVFAEAAALGYFARATRIADSGRLLRWLAAVAAGCESAAMAGSGSLVRRSLW